MMARVPLVLLGLSFLAPLVSANFSARYVSFRDDPTPVVSGAILPAAEFSLPIAGKAPRSKARAALRTSLRAHVSGDSHIAPLAGSDLDQEYLVNATVGGQKFTLIVDTGSSDTWVVEKGFKCSNLTGSPEPASECAFGTSGYNPKKSKTYTAFPDRNFNIEYGDGEYLTGTVGFETVSVGGLTVPKQEFGLVNKAAWAGDGVNSGLLGLCFPNLTSVYIGTNTSDDSSANNEPYKPFFFSAVKDKLVSKPYFSVALNRGSFKAQETSSYDANLGYLAFGGVAPVPTIAPSVKVPFQGYQTNSSGTGYYFYIATIDKYIFPGSNKLHTWSKTTILDTGTTLNYIPTDAAAAYNAAFDPPAKNSETYGGYVTICKAKAPPFSAVIGGKAFHIDGRDQLLPLDVKDKQGRALCLTGTQDGGADTDGNIFILGDVFLHNVVATFNIAAYDVTLSQRKPY